MLGGQKNEKMEAILVFHDMYFVQMMKNRDEVPLFSFKEKNEMIKKNSLLELLYCHIIYNAQ